MITKFNHILSREDGGDMSELFLEDDLVSLLRTTL